MKQKKFNPFKNLKLDAYEQEIEDAIGRGEFKTIDNFEAENKRYQKIAAYTLKQMKKNKNINIRVNETVLLKFKAKAMKEGLPYQTLISSLIHKYVNA